MEATREIVAVPDAAANDRRRLGPNLSYLVKAAIFVVVLAVFSKIAPGLPAWALAIFWAAASLLAAVGVAYHSVIEKTFNQSQYEPESGSARVNKGRALTLVVSFVLSAICVSGIIVECPAWEAPMWALVVISVPLFLAVKIIAQRFSKSQWRPLKRISKATIISEVATAILLCVAYAAIVFFAGAPEYSCAAQAFTAAPDPFSESPSFVMSELGKVLALVSGLTSYALSKTAQVNYGGYVVWQVVLGWATMLGVSGLLGACSISGEDLKRVFLPVPENQDDRPSGKPMFGYVLVAAALPVVLVAGFTAIEAKSPELFASGPYTVAQKFVREQVDFVVYEYDGKHYDKGATDALLERAQEERSSLNSLIEDKIVPLVNASYDARLDNVDSYLDWYYGLFTDYEMLFHTVTDAFAGESGKYAEERFSTLIEDGIDDSALDKVVEEYESRLIELSNLKDELSKYEITDGYPEWLVTGAEPLGDVEISELDFGKRRTEALERTGLSSAGGVVAGVAAKKLLAKVVQKEFFKGILNKVAALTAVGSTSASLGPAGVVVGVAAGVLIDVAATKSDELLNRETYKQEIEFEINDQREEFLAAFREQVTS